MNKLLGVSLLFLAGLFASYETLAQQHYSSEHNALVLELQQDKLPIEQLKLLNDLAEWHTKNAKEGAETYIERAIQLADSLESQANVPYLNYEKCRTLLYRSYEEFSMRDMETVYVTCLELDSIASYSLANLNKKDARYKELKKQYGLWRNEAMQNRAFAVYSLGYPEKAFKLLSDAIDMAEEIHSDEFLGRAYKKRAEVFGFLGSYKMAVKDYHDAIKYLKRADNLEQPLVAISYVAMGNQYARIGEFRSAISAYNEGLKHLEELKNVLGMASVSYNIALTYHESGDYEYAARYAKKAKENYTKVGDEQGVASCQDVLASVSYHRGDYTSVIENAIESLKLRSDYGDDIGALKTSDVLMFAYLSTARYLEEFDEGDYYTYQAHLFSQKAALEYGLKISLDGLKDFSLLSACLEADSVKFNMRAIVSDVDSLIIVPTQPFAKSKARQSLKRKLAAFQQSNQKYTIELQEQRISASRLRLYVVALTLLVMVILALFILLRARKEKQVRELLQVRNAQIEEQQTVLNKQFEETHELMGFKERMTNMIIHDLKTPLNGIMSAEFIEDEALKTEIIRHSASEMMNLVQNVLDFNKSQETDMTVKRRKVNFASVVESETRNIRFILDEKMLNMKFEDTNLPKFSADPQLFRRVISNIFSNAAKYSPQGGSIFVTARVENQTDVRILISNQGPPIPEDQVGLIFKPFGQAEAKDFGKASSTGLGLAFCQMAVDAHGGSIGVTPNKNDGAEFWILLPNSIEV